MKAYEIHLEAQAAGKLAASNAKPIAQISRSLVKDGSGKITRRTRISPEGPRGFVRLTVLGTGRGSDFISGLRAVRLAGDVTLGKPFTWERDEIRGGYTHHVLCTGLSLTRGTQYAHAYRDILSGYGVKANVGVYGLRDMQEAACMSS